MSDFVDDEYEHWPAVSSHSSQPTAPAFSYAYNPTKKSESPKQPPEKKQKKAKKQDNEASSQHVTFQAMQYETGDAAANYTFGPAPTEVAQADLTWQGRTSAEVEEDNQIIAAREGANTKRDGKPAGLSPDQVVWVVEVDGAHTLRTFGNIEGDGMKGEWMVDPRFGSWFFVREEEKEDNDNKEKGDKQK